MQQPQLSQNLIDITDYICLPLSTLGSLYMIHAFVTNPRKSFPAKLIVSLAISNLVLSLINFMDLITKDSMLCNLQGFVRSIGIYSQMIWATEILAILYLQFIWRVPQLENHFWGLVVFNVMISSLPSIVTAISQAKGGNLFFGSTQGSCNIMPLEDYVYLMVIPFAILVLLSCFMTLKVYYVLKSLDINFMNLEYKNLFAFPAILVVLYVPTFIDFALGGFVQGGFYEILTGLVFCLTKSLGVINAIIYRRTFFTTKEQLNSSISEIGTMAKSSEFMLNSSYNDV